MDSNFLALSCSLDKYGKKNIDFLLYPLTFPLWYIPMLHSKGDSQVQLLSAVATSNGVDRLLEELRLAEPKYDFELVTLSKT